MASRPSAETDSAHHRHLASLNAAMKLYILIALIAAAAHAENKAANGTVIPSPIAKQTVDGCY